MTRPARGKRTGNIQELLKSLGGADTGRDLYQRLNDPDIRIDDVVRELVMRPEFEQAYKHHRTGNIMDDGRMEADPAFVGLPDLDISRPFATQFQTAFKPRLARRADSFELMFDRLSGRRAPFILETGCLRVGGNWEGDGQSTFQFDSFVRDVGGSVISIDITPDSIESARRACSGATSLILNDSVAALHMLSLRCGAPVDLIYLDSFDLDHANPMPSAIHHIMELTAVRPLIGPDTLLCIDDYNVGDLGPGGKGLLVDRFMKTIRAEVLYDGYQKIWQVLP
ncbi:class I SAM-dependent methyltransferase [Novacetimonas cocois]|nr:hypothetical protein [Novacetimonas cocois]